MSPIVFIQPETSKISHTATNQKKNLKKLIFRRDFHISILRAAWPKKASNSAQTITQQIFPVEQPTKLFHKLEVKLYPLV